MVAAPATCRITGAWTLAGQPVDAPSVTRCVLPRFPESMRTARQEGEIVWRISVDSAGLPDSSSLRVIRTSTPTLATAVARAAPYLRFAPSPSRPIIVVELPTTFQLTR